VTNPQPVAISLMESVMADSMEIGAGLPDWVPHEGKVAVQAAGGQMSR
jgi:hypothetical protein